MIQLLVVLLLLYSIELACNLLFLIVTTLVFGYLLVGIISTGLYTVLSYLIVGVNTLISHILTASLNLLACHAKYGPR